MNSKTRLVLFFKAEQFDLFAAPVNVKAGVRGGKAVKAYTRVQKVAPAAAPKSDYSASAGKYAYHTNELTAAAMRTSVKPNGYPHTEEQLPSGNWFPNGSLRHVRAAHAALRDAGIAFADDAPAGPGDPVRDAADDTRVKRDHASDRASMRRYAAGIHAEEERALKSPEYKALVAQSEAEVAKMRAARQKK